jgi:hypothetical protein
MRFFAKSRRIRGGNRKTKKAKKVKMFDYDSDPGEPELVPQKKRRRDNSIRAQAHRVFSHYLKRDRLNAPIIVVDSSDDESEPELMPRKR